MFSKSENNVFKDLIEGVKYYTSVWGTNSSLGKFHLKEGSVIPVHSHINEQTGYLISGEMKFNIDGEEYIAEAGDSWNIPANVGHAAEAIKDSIIIEIFSPRRDDYIHIK